MIKIRDYEMKSSLTEWTIGEYERIIKILSDDKLDYIDKYIKVLEYLGVPDDILDTMDDEEFFYIVENILDNNIGKEYKKSFEIDGYEYVAYEGDTYKLSVKDMGKIETIVKSEADDKLSRILAVIFKRSDLTNIEHYDKTHLEYKSKLFKQLNADIVIPYIILIEEKMVKKLVYLNEKKSS